MKEFGKLLIFATFLALLLHISAVINAQTVDKHNEQQSVASLNISSASDGPVAVVKSSARITSYNVCYTKLLRTENSLMSSGCRK